MTDRERPGLDVTSAFPGCVCHPVDEFPRTHIGRPPWSYRWRRSRAFGIETAPITVGTTDPVEPVASATLESISVAAMIDAPMIQPLRLFISFPPF